MIHLPLQQRRPGASLKAALALTGVSRDPFRFPVEPNPDGGEGLQGTTAEYVDAFAEVFDARVETFGADPLTWVYQPSRSETGEEEFRLHVDSPGSSAELVGLMLPGLLQRDYPTRLVIEGCTHARGAYLPEQLESALARLVGDVGGTLEVELDAYGFPPRGGGRLVAEVTPAEGRLREVRWGDRGYVRDIDISVTLAHLQAHIGEREIRTFVDEMKAEVSTSASLTELHAAASQGNVMTVYVYGSEQLETICVLGEKGVRAEEIGRRSLSEFATYLAGRGAFHQTTPFATLLACAAGGDQVWTTGLDELGRAVCEYAPALLGTHVNIQGEDTETTRLNIYR